MENLNRRMGTFALTMTGIGSIIGSGWLFGAWKAAKVAGPAAIFAWVIGAFAIMLIGLVYAELGATFPESGGAVRYAQYSHGSLTGFIAGWANWIAIVSVIPIEAEASIQYMSSWPWHWVPSWIHNLYNGSSLTAIGLFFAAILVVIYFLINYWTVQLFARVNTLITVFKLGIPALTALGLIFAGFHPGNFTHFGGFAPNGWASVLTAIATSGVVFAFNGFQSPVNFAGEARNPNKSIPRAVVGSILISAVIYVLLQVALIGGVKPDMLANGWSHLNLKSPFADLALAWGLNWLAIILFADAFVSPSGTGLTYTATTARMVYGMSENGWFPRVFGTVHPFYKVPRRAMWLNLTIGFAFLLMFRGWGQLAGVISVATLVSYVTGPVAVMSLRKTAPNLARPLKLASMKFLAPVAFMVASLILYWAKWPLTGEVIFVMLVGLPMFLYYQGKDGWVGFSKSLKSGSWLVAYMFYMMLISYLGSSKFGGINVIPYGWDMVVVALSSLVFYAWGTRSGWRTKQVDETQEWLEKANTAQDGTTQSL
ncbi:APC family permease [Alicyclobacillus tolerans]|uniref:APC family permease n=1 Tax=Alicyclobacillus tolerans TaxID=90970 RepID=UPI001F436DFB|nr:APC family permease [Alicyclobacillus tolerans]MCF8566801.1 APC family permease [Alicyclobacillus tolerans]